MARELDPRLVFAKTAAGSAEVARRSHGLSGAARRILIVIDGQRRLSDLPPFARAGELEPIVDDLEARGLIALVGIADDPPEHERVQAQRRQRDALARLQRELAGTFQRELGAAGRVYDARLADCVSLDVVRPLLREAIDAVLSARGQPAAQRILAVVRPVFDQLTAPPGL
jgi:hypothetical protein